MENVVIKFQFQKQKLSNIFNNVISKLLMIPNKCILSKFSKYYITVYIITYLYFKDDGI